MQTGRSDPSPPPETNKASKQYLVMRTFAIGDIHGCSVALKRLDSQLRFSTEDTVVLLGDYVDRGPDTKGALDYIIELQSRCRLIPLRGNHEIMMLRARDDRSAIMEWEGCGGDETLASYKAQSFADIPASHWKFLSSTQAYYETKTDFFVHAGVDPNEALADQPDYMLYWEFFEDPAPHRSGKRMICGHTSQKSGRPKNVGHAVCIDTYAHGGGWLTCLEMKSDRYWQANQQGQLRTGELE